MTIDNTNNTKFINSGKIDVFPCGGRNSDYDATSKLTTEYNLVSIINRLVDQGSFVVSNSLPATGDFLFNIGGYLFSTSDLTFGGLMPTITEQNRDDYIGCYIVAYINPTNYNTTYMQLSPLNATSTTDFITATYGGILDTEDGFTGIKFVLIPQSNIPTDGSVLKVDDGKGNTYTFGYTRENATTNGIIHVTKTQLPLLQFDGSSWVIPPDSKIKFRTAADGKYRSVAIDDGELTVN